MIEPTAPDHICQAAEGLRNQLAMASVAARDAYRDTARLIRLLSVIGEPAAPDRLVGQALSVLSDVFSASVTCMAHRIGDRLQVAGVCGLPEDKVTQGLAWPLAPAAVEALTSGRAVARHDPAETSDLPPALAGLNVNAAAWIPMSADRSSGALIVLYRSTREPFSQGDLQVLLPVARRLHLSVETAERRAAQERLARLGHRLSQYLDPRPLLEEAIEAFRDLVGSDRAAVILVEHGRAMLAAQSGHAPAQALAWPRPAGESASWAAALHGQPYRGPDRWTAPAEQLAEEPGGATPICLSVPLVRDGAPIGLLSAVRDVPRPFSEDAVEVATIFANHLGAALANADLYRALAQSESRLRLITDAISDLVAEVDGTGTLCYVSPSYAREVAHEPRSLLGRSVVELAHPEDRPHLRHALAQAQQAPKVEYRLRTGVGGWVWVESALRPAPSTDGGIVLSSRVVDERKQLENELWQRATHDPLTGLANRALVGQHLDRALSSSAPALVGLLFCDLDKFKSVNDRLGHEAGDDLLRQVAARLQTCVRPGDLLGRLGGDEFVVVLDGIDSLDEVTRVGRRVLAALADPMLVSGERLQMSVSVGGVIGQRRMTTAADLLRDADAAMYNAKKNGRGRVEVFDDDAARRALDRLGLESDMSRAVERNELVLHYQPIVRLDSSKVVGFEALLRWIHPERGVIPPDVLIPLAEETGAIVQIGRWVLAEACRQLADWQRRFPRATPLTMNVNVSAMEIRDRLLASEMVATVREAGVDPSDVWLEIAEHGYLNEEVVTQLATLREAGVHLALDDFGMFYSNLSYLKRFPIECLKIDRSFVAGLGAEKVDRAIVRAVMAIADSLGLDVVAEGIETERQRAELGAVGCPRGQGFLFAPGLPAVEATRLLAAAPVRRAS